MAPFGAFMDVPNSFQDFLANAAETPRIQTGIQTGIQAAARS
jgi:hypothetical protein